MSAFLTRETIIENSCLFGARYISLDDQGRGHLGEVSASFLEGLDFLETRPSLPGIGLQHERKLDLILMADFPEPAVPLPFTTRGNQKCVGSEFWRSLHQTVKNLRLGLAHHTAVL